MSLEFLNVRPKSETETKRPLEWVVQINNSYVCAVSQLVEWKTDRSRSPTTGH